ncbi:hypothetical protein FQR65_LT02677 [Abscondita terminalis]|nr:hypothetical protein FQR65_LT02677 [Abscondita terminalis]
MIIDRNILYLHNIRLLSSHRSFEEIKVPVPWGHLAGKWWSPHDRKPILATHGWQDNAGSFDRLVSYLPSDIGILALDFPGHGLSSYLPKGFFYHHADSIALYKRILKYFNWDKVSLMGHSLGATCNFNYAIAYPKEVEILICLDGWYAISKTKSKLEIMAETIDQFLKLDNINNSDAVPPSFTIEELKQRMYVASWKSIDIEHSEGILRRSILPAQNKPDKFHISRDVRLKNTFIQQWSLDMIFNGSTRVKCPIFINLHLTIHMYLMIINRSTLHLNNAKNVIFRFLSSQRSFEEIKLPLPWGHLAGKWWSPYDRKPILATHGWQDNAGSFDRLISYFPSDVGVLALDFPGHGLSSHLPKGFFYHSADSIALYKRIFKYFNWDKVSLMGHSLGATCNLTYAIAYPNEVEMLICLDGLYFISKTKAKLEIMAKTIDQFLKMDNINNSNSAPPAFTMEELKQRMYVASWKSVDIEHSEFILRRSVLPAKNNPDKFHINRDVRLKNTSILQWSHDMMFNGVTKVKCPIFISIGNNSHFAAKQLENFKKLFSIIKEHNDNCYFYEVEGTHHAHVNSPETIAVLLNQFLTKHYLNNLVQQLSSKIRTYEEVRIPVPWGHIAGKWWGPQDKRPILAIHGWQDNCGTFDTLIPCLPSNLAILAIDSPGHGLSSHFPPGMFYHGVDTVIILRRIVQFFNWNKVSLLGHSLGGIFNYLYVMLYPETIDFIINFDAVKPLVFEDKKIERMIKSVETFLRYESIIESESEPRSYTFEELERMLHEGSRKSVSLECCKYILERNIAPSKLEPHKFVITRDLRVKVPPLLGMVQKDIVERTKSITCPYFVSKSSESPFVENKKYTLEVVDILKEVNKDFWLCEVEGTHHVHLNNPERVAEVVIPFIKKYDVHDRSKGGLMEDIRIKSKNFVDIPM